MIISFKVLIIIHCRTCSVSLARPSYCKCTQPHTDINRPHKNIDMPQEYLLIYDNKLPRHLDDMSVQCINNHSFFLGTEDFNYKTRI